MASSLKVIALISGGKDSLFSMLHCEANGHKVVALANLHPASSTNDNEDIDSYMYQTVGHSIIPLYEQALDLPLYRQEINGSAVNSSRDYEESAEQEQDETEDLVPLLRKVMQKHPEADAVSTGAILSTYQRTRVESVALRLGLTPLSFLWQYPMLPPYSQSQLLHDMAAVGQEAIIIKTASGGLDESFLALDVTHQRTITRLSTTMAHFGEAGNGAIVGEGGEFETLALNGPSPLWKKRIKIEESSPEVVDGGQTVLKIRASKLEEEIEVSADDGGVLRIPELFDDEFKRILEDEDNWPRNQSTPSGSPFLAASDLSHDASSNGQLSMNVYSDTPTVFTYSNLISDTHPSSSSSPSRQLTRILLRLDHVLQQHSLSKTNINHCTLLLRNMADFTTLNPVYGQYFSTVNPPTRVTIATGDCMPTGNDVMLSIVLDKDVTDAEGKTVQRKERQGLHVQGRSYWAPANIGPYCQTVSVQLPPVTIEGTHPGEMIYVAGQIPLIPAPMTAYTSRGFKGQALLSLQHLWRIGRSKNVKWWTAGIAFIPASPSPEDNVRLAQEMWTRIHTPNSAATSDDEDDIDPWDQINNRGAAFNDNTYRAPIPDFTTIKTLPTTTNLPIPPCFVAQVEALPRDVDIEWSATGLTSREIMFKTDYEQAGVTITTPTSSRSRFITLEIREMRDLEVLSRLGEDSMNEWTNATLYTGRGFKLDEGMKKSSRATHWIPCKTVWGEEGREVRGVLVGRVDRSAD